MGTAAWKQHSTLFRTWSWSRLCWYFTQGTLEQNFQSQLVQNKLVSSNNSATECLDNIVSQEFSVRLVFTIGDAETFWYFYCNKWNEMIDFLTSWLLVCIFFWCCVFSRHFGSPSVPGLESTVLSFPSMPHLMGVMAADISGET